MLKPSSASSPHQPLRRTIPAPPPPPPPPALGPPPQARIQRLISVFALTWIDPGRDNKMALRGVWQLQKLMVNYCDWGGSSRGIRAFVETCLPAFKEKNPQLEVVTELVRGQHPNLKGIYSKMKITTNEWSVRNLSPEDILLQATRLKNSLGRKVVKLRTRHVTKRPSVQGTWTTEMKM
ncbi:hypothetical protein PR202_gb20676 [Eleusine coracana subsp. coracana]|uniref:Large ribosomal subunit protein mL43 n=1 Tax=Eleusine coracana subsp. coracana TaxID=191504 RepID=A0AAV5FB23_ELECO|nr:hypothetical protein PR202_gb20676 [Eleusine coracana subsp. coracana]